MRSVVSFAVGLLTAQVLCGQVVLETSFEKGIDAPEGWKLSGEPGAWEHEGRTGTRSVSVTGNGNDQNGWEFRPSPVEARKTYRFSVWFRSDAKGGSRVMAIGSDLKLGRQAMDWQRMEFVFRAPDVIKKKAIRLGQWHVTGKTFYDDFRLERVNVSYLEKDGIALGHGERIENGTYVFEPTFRSYYGDAFRVDEGHTVVYHSGMWWFYNDEYAVQRYSIGGHQQLSGEVYVKLRQMDARKKDNAITVEAGTDGTNWTELGTYTAVSEYRETLPAAWFPAKTVFVRVRGKGSVQVNGYRYSAKLDGSTPNMTGKTEAFQGGYAVVDNGRLRLTFEEGALALVSIARKGEPVGRIECRLAQFEKEGMGYKGTGIGVAQATRVKRIEVTHSDPTKCVIHVTVERAESLDAERRFEAAYELAIYAGQEWFESRLLSVKNTDRKWYELRGYFHRVQPTGNRAVKPWCCDTVSAWICDGMILGATAKRPDDFTLGLRLAGAEPHGDVTRKESAGMTPGETWAAEQPAVIVFVADGAKPADVVRTCNEIREIAKAPDQHAEGAIVLKNQTRKPDGPKSD